MTKAGQKNVSPFYLTNIGEFYGNYAYRIKF